MKRTLGLFLAAVLGLVVLGAGSVYAGDDGDPRDYQRDVERKLRDLERREHERQRHAERKYLNEHISPREHVEIQRRLERKRQEDLHDYEEWREDRDHDFYRSQDRRLDRYDRRYIGPGVTVYGDNYVPYSSGYRGDRGGFGISTPRFSIYIDR